MNETYVDQLRAVADYIARADCPELLSATTRKNEVHLHGWVTGKNRLSTFLPWIDTLDGPVEITASPHESADRREYLMYGRGLLPGTAFPAELVVILHGAEFEALVEEIGFSEDDVPVTRTQLAKIADPELLDDRAAVTP